MATAVLGINNTLVTQAAMTVSRAERPVASAGYNFVRWIGGAVAPWLAGELAVVVGARVPFLVGAVAVAMGAVVLAGGRRHLGALPQRPSAPGRGRALEEIAKERATGRLCGERAERVWTDPGRRGAALAIVPGSGHTRFGSTLHRGTRSAAHKEGCAARGRRRRDSPDRSARGR